jgi:hypothetical protein
MLHPPIRHHGASARERQMHNVPPMSQKRAHRRQVDMKYGIIHRVNEGIP